jgi:exopolyphosphatase/guanosine-5'-triphosphate,3'-diphosphate pyrophosphatase
MDQADGGAIAIFDLGTNTFNLMVRSVDGSIIHRGKISVKLGKDSMQTGHITDDAISRGIDAIKTHLLTAKSHKASKAYAFATSAFRSAANGQSVAHAIKQATGIDVHIISGEKEAGFIARGVAQALPHLSEPRLIVDIGGGSTECIVMNQTDVVFANSYPLGVIRLLESHQPADPMTSTDIQAITQDITLTLSGLLDNCKRWNPKVMIGSSGSFDAIYQLLTKRLGLKKFKSKDKHASMNRQALINLLNDLIASSRTTFDAWNR